jgi:ADP-ribosyl-[dinitrogen reductase] hydrolase
MWSVACETASWGTECGTREDRGAVHASLLAAREGRPKEAIRNQGWVLIALRNAFHRLLTGQSIEEALVETVVMGGDTDTNAAICGALLGTA